MIPGVSETFCLQTAIQYISIQETPEMNVIINKSL